MLDNPSSLAGYEDAKAEYEDWKDEIESKENKEVELLDLWLSEQARKEKNE